MSWARRRHPTAHLTQVGGECLSTAESAPRVEFAKGGYYTRHSKRQKFGRGSPVCSAEFFEPFVEDLE
jgi:hypothetical protein